MGLLELFILAVGLSMDAFAVSVCKGLAMPKITVEEGSCRRHMVRRISGADARFGISAWFAVQRKHYGH